MDGKVGDFEGKYGEIKDLYTELKAIKEVSDIRSAYKYFQDNLRDYINTTTLMKDLIKRIKIAYPELAS